MNVEFPKWVWALGGLVVVAIAYDSKTKIGVMIVIITLLALVGNAYRSGEIKNV